MGTASGMGTVTSSLRAPQAVPGNRLKLSVANLLVTELPSPQSPDRLRTRRWVWVDGNTKTLIGYTNWFKGQPNNYGSNNQLVAQGGYNLQKKTLSGSRFRD